MYSNQLAPIVFFVYNRPTHTYKTIEALKNNKLADQSDLIIYSDHAKNIEAVKEVEQVRNYIYSISGFKSITVIERDRNWGLANSIIDGVTTVVNQYGRIIVLEDDMETSPYFLSYMNDALEYYKDELKVFGITGFAYPVNNENLPITYFMKDEGCWGWATWSRAWQYFEKDTDYLMQIFTRQMIKDFNFDNTIDFWNQIILNSKGEINTWAIYWYATIFLKDGLFLHPKDTFVKNIGHDGSGVHCDNTNEFNSSMVEVYEKIFPMEIEVCNIAREEHKIFFSKSSIIKRIMRRIHSFLRVMK
ncbi:glycosyltransferase [Acinetobacter wuhouensis]|uniref:Glycosyltransferase n=1 Tax=Acinetobacter wuhouensis TaxID=1879050 RepID=A0A4Q7ASM0_9GAMM|nr:glycosyltransferase [Acinetobacter wuhouensis]RZG49145.1 glycosyltransferase [Acinetobacter wuhouensis]